MKVCVLGANGFIGKNLLEMNPTWTGVSREVLDLTVQEDVDEYFQLNKFDTVIHCAVVGGSRLQKDSGDVCYKNLLMFENVVRNKKRFHRFIYFSSGAAMRGEPPTDPYGFSKWLIEYRVEQIPYAYCLRIWGCYGPHEPPTRFSAVCKRDGHVVIPQDRLFDFIDVRDVNKIVVEYCHHGGKKFRNLTYTAKSMLSSWASFFGATYTIEKEGFGEPYVSS